jgi:hypothetical protein
MAGAYERHYRNFFREINFRPKNTFRSHSGRQRKKIAILAVSEGGDTKTRVTRWVCEKIIRNAAQPIFVKFKAYVLQLSKKHKSVGSFCYVKKQTKIKHR